jgi:hypothetical protein
MNRLHADDGGDTFDEDRHGGSIVARMERSEIRDRRRGLLSRSRITRRSIRATPDPDGRRPGIDRPRNHNCRKEPSFRAE